MRLVLLMACRGSFLKSSATYQCTRTLIEPVTPQRIHFRFLQTREKGNRISFDSGSKIVRQLHVKDRVPIEEYDLIYRCTFPNYVLMCQAANFALFLWIGYTMFQDTYDAVVSDSSSDKDKPQSGPSNFVEEEKIHKKFEDAEEDTWRNLFGFTKKWKEGWDAMEAQQEANRSAQLPWPKVQDLQSGGVGTVVAIFVLMGALMYSIIKFQNILPMRIYTSKSAKSGHTIGIFYGHVVPGLTTRKQFVVGTFERAKTNRWLPSTQVFQDPKGRKVVLFEKMFRYPADFNRLLGLQKDFKHGKFEDEEHRQH